MTIAKPAQLSGRGREWRAVTRLVENPEPGAELGLVYGRRQGKTFLLDLLAEATGGFMFTAVQQSGPQNLRMLGAAYAHYLGLNDPARFAYWQAAVDALLRLGAGNTTTCSRCSSGLWRRPYVRADAGTACDATPGGGTAGGK